ncbi:MAG: DUF4389 domain-containing protein [Actinobacteria bacterium]|nr:MAG: DUF4389 domain-containing protein [Actinomycetota bacterium]
MSYPVRFEADYVERRSRLTTLLRLILVIPAALLLYLYAIVAGIVIVIAWFAIVITGRYPAGLYNFVAGYTRCLVRVTSYALLLCDPYPPLGGSPDDSYPVRMRFDGPLERYSRARTLFRIILAIPIAVLRYVLGLLLEVCAVGAWFVILAIGKLPRGLFDVMVLASSYTARSDAYLFLLTETYPPFQEPPPAGAGPASPVTAAAPPPPTA